MKVSRAVFVINHLAKCEKYIMSPARRIGGARHQLHRHLMSQHRDTIMSTQRAFFADMFNPATFAPQRHVAALLADWDEHPNLLWILITGGPDDVFDGHDWPWQHLLINKEIGRRLGVGWYCGTASAIGRVTDWDRDKFTGKHNWGYVAPTYYELALLHRRDLFCERAGGVAIHLLKEIQRRDGTTLRQALDQHACARVSCLNSYDGSRLEFFLEQIDNEDADRDIWDLLHGRYRISLLGDGEHWEEGEGTLGEIMAAAEAAAEEEDVLLNPAGEGEQGEGGEGEFFDSDSEEEREYWERQYAAARDRGVARDGEGEQEGQPWQEDARSAALANAEGQLMPEILSLLAEELTCAPAELMFDWEDVPDGPVFEWVGLSRRDSEMRRARERAAELAEMQQRLLETCKKMSRSPSRSC